MESHREINLLLTEPLSHDQASIHLNEKVFNKHLIRTNRVNAFEETLLAAVLNGDIRDLVEAIFEPSFTSDENTKTDIYLPVTQAEAELVIKYFNDLMPGSAQFAKEQIKHQSMQRDAVVITVLNRVLVTEKFCEDLNLVLDRAPQAALDRYRLNSGATNMTTQECIDRLNGAVEKAQCENKQDVGQEVYYLSGFEVTVRQIMAFMQNPQFHLAKHGDDLRLLLNEIPDAYFPYVRNAITNLKRLIELEEGIFALRQFELNPPPEFLSTGLQIEPPRSLLTVQAESLRTEPVEFDTTKKRKADHLAEPTKPEKQKKLKQAKPKEIKSKKIKQNEVDRKKVAREPKRKTRSNTDLSRLSLFNGCEWKIPELPTVDWNPGPTLRK
jgi:hypothetical protein